MLLLIEPVPVSFMEKSRGMGERELKQLIP